MKKALSLMAALAAMATLGSCDSKPEQANLVLLYTTDVHGACLHYDFKKDAPACTSLANVCTYVKQQREEHPGAVMLMDAGDYLQGQPSVYYYNFIDTLSEHIVPRVYNYLQYDAVAIGNHDIEPGEDVYFRRLPSQFQMPVLCANAIDKRTGKPMFQPYTTLERQGVKVAILGMITPNIHAWLPQSLWPNLEFEDMVECARKWVPVIQQRENPDLLIGLFHSGGDYTGEGIDLDTPFNENGGVPAAIKVPGFDIVLCGHDHQERQFTVENVAGDTVIVLDARTQAAKVGRADISLTRKGGKYSKKISTELIRMSSYAPDSIFCRDFQSVVDTVNDYVNATLGELTAPLYGQPAMYGPSEFQDFIHEVQLSATGADISFASLLSPHDTVPAGPITMRQLFTLYKYENQLFTMRMSGQNVKDYLEFGYGNQFGTMTSPNDHLLAYKRDAKGNILNEGRGPVYKTFTFNYTCAAGIRYTVDVSKPEGERVTILSMSDGTPFDLLKDYLVAINSYQASGGGNFLPVGLGWDSATIEEHTVSATPKDVRRFVAEYIQEHHTITPRLRGDWEVIPHDWWKRGMQNDIKFANPLAR